jgi:hypothetical protein
MSQLPLYEAHKYVSFVYFLFLSPHDNRNVYATYAHPLYPTPLIGNRNDTHVSPEEYLSIRRERILAMIASYRTLAATLESRMAHQYRAFQSHRAQHLSADVKIMLPRTPEDGGLGSLVEAAAGHVQKAMPVPSQKEYDAPRCIKARCTQAVVPLTQYCLTHILNDGSQRLWVGCSAKGCKTPVLRQGLIGGKLAPKTGPRYCPLHGKQLKRKEREEEEHAVGGKVAEAGGSRSSSHASGNAGGSAKRRRVAHGVGSAVEVKPYHE